MKPSVAASRRAASRNVNAPPGTPPTEPTAGYNASGVWVGSTMPTEPPPGYTRVVADDFNRSTLNTTTHPTRWGVYDNSFSGANPDSSWWEGDLVTVENGMLRCKQQVRTRAHRNGTVDRRIESGTAHLWGMPPVTYPQFTLRIQTHGPFVIEGVVGTVLMLWPYSDEWPRDTEVDFLEESHPHRGRSNYHWGTVWPDHHQTGFRNWDVPGTGTRTVMNTIVSRINPPNHPTHPYRNETWVNGVLVDSWNPPTEWRQSWPMVPIIQTESYIRDNDTATWTGPTGKQLMDQLEPLGVREFVDVDFACVDAAVV